MVLKTLTIIISVFSFLPVSAQMQTLEEVPENHSNIEEELKLLHNKIELYFQSYKEFLAEQQRAPTPLDELTKESLDVTRAEIQIELIDYQKRIQELSTTESTDVVERSKHIYNLALTKAFLPRFEPEDRSLLKKIVQHADPVFVDSIFSRTEAQKLFFTEFQTHKGKAELNAEYRVKEVTKLYNKIIDKINAFRETNLLANYNAKSIIKNVKSESEVYNLILSGQESISENDSRSKTASRSAIQVEQDHFITSPTCSGLFSSGL